MATWEWQLSQQRLCFACKDKRGLTRLRRNDCCATRERPFTIRCLYSSEASCTAVSQALEPLAYTLLTSSIQYLQTRRGTRKIVAIVLNVFTVHAGHCGRRPLSPLTLLVFQRPCCLPVKWQRLLCQIKGFLNKCQGMFLSYQKYIFQVTYIWHPMFCECKQFVVQLLTDTKYGPAKSLMTPVEVQIPMWPINGKSHLKTEPKKKSGWYSRTIDATRYNYSRQMEACFKSMNRPFGRDITETNTKHKNTPTQQGLKFHGISSALSRQYTYFINFIIVQQEVMTVREPASQLASQANGTVTWFGSFALKRNFIWTTEAWWLTTARG